MLYRNEYVAIPQISLSQGHQLKHKSYLLLRFHSCKTHNNHRQEVSVLFYIFHIHKDTNRYLWAWFLTSENHNRGR